MPLARIRNLWLLAPAALLVVLWWPGAAPSGRAGEHVSAVTAPALRALALSDGPVRETGPELSLPPNLRADFEAQTDLYQYAQTLVGEVRSGDAEATWMLSRVYDYCSAYALDPSGYQADSQWISQQSSTGLANMTRARAQVARRCAGFTPADGLTAQKVVSERAQAAQSGSLAAEAALLALGQPLEPSDTYKRGLVDRVLASRDPEAYLALSPAMGAAASGDDAYRGYVAGDQFAQLAWQLAACRLGLNCGAQSALMTSYCVNGGICSQNSSQDFSSFVFDAAVPRQGADQMDNMVNTLLKGPLLKGLGGQS